MDGRIDPRRLIGMADACELLSYAWAFPDARLASAVADGSLLADADSCLADLGLSDEDGHLAEMRSVLGELRDRAVGDVEVLLRREHSRLFLVAGADPAVYPYETAFRHRASGGEGLPSLYGSATMHDVERQMRAAGVAPAGNATEPVDSVWNEFSFLAYLYGGLAQATVRARDELVGDASCCSDVWLRRVASFYGTHVAFWMPDFMDCVEKAADALGLGGTYRGFALIGRAVLGEMARDADWMS